jgi:type VI protein secretion system component VasF
VVGPTLERPVSTDPPPAEDEVQEFLRSSAGRAPRWLVAIGVLAWLTTVYLGYQSLTQLGRLF